MPRTVRPARASSTASDRPTAPIPTTVTRAVCSVIRRSSAVLQLDMSVMIGHVTQWGKFLPYNPRAVIRRPWLLLVAPLAALGVVVAIWTSIDRRPPEWDYANHLGRALQCYRILAEPGHDRAREILEATAFYPPVTTCAGGLLYFLFPVVPLTAPAVMPGFPALW